MPKQIPAIWLYDERGSRLFDEITRLPEYYLTRTERQILEERAPEIALETRAESLVELGSGTSEKTRLLLDALVAEGTLSRFVPLDVSEGVLDRERARDCGGVPGTRGACGRRRLRATPRSASARAADDSSPFSARRSGASESRLGRGFLRAVATSLGAEDTLLLGLDLVKDPARIEAAYADSSGLSERFQRNGLANLDRELGSDFSQGRFEHYAVWDAEHEWVDIGFRSLGAQVVQVSGTRDPGRVRRRRAPAHERQLEVSARPLRGRARSRRPRAPALVDGHERRLRGLPRGSRLVAPVARRALVRTMR